MRGVKPAEYAKYLGKYGGRTEFLLNETTVLKTNGEKHETDFVD